MIKFIKQKVKSFFLAGLLVTLPAAFTIYAIIILFNLVDRLLGPTVTKMLIILGVPIEPTYHIPGLGIFITLLIIFISGILVTNFIGRKLVDIGEWVVHKIPIMGSVYAAVKQIIATLTKSDSSAFKKVVVFEYPMKGIYTVGFIASDTYYKMQEMVKEDVVNVFVPTVPNVTTGFFLMVPKENLSPLPMSVEEGIKMIISGGMIIPKDGHKAEK